MTKKFPNKGLPIEKQLPSGDLVKTYDSVYQAMRGEYLGYDSLKSAIARKTEINGHILSFAHCQEEPVERVKKKKKPNASHPVVKRLPDGTEVRTYARLIDAMAAEAISHRVLKAALENGKIINGHKYTYLLPRPVGEDKLSGRQK